MHTHETHPSEVQPESRPVSRPLFTAHPSFDVTYPGQQNPSSSAHPFPLRSHTGTLGTPGLTDQRTSSSTPDRQTESATSESGLNPSPFSLYAPGESPPNPPRLTAIQMKCAPCAGASSSHQESARLPGGLIQRVSPQIQRNCASSSECIASLDQTRINLRALIRLALHGSLTEDANFQELLMTAGSQILPNEISSGLERRTQDVAGLQVPQADQSITLPIALRNLRTLLTANLPPGVSGGQPTYSVGFLIQGIATDIANYFLGALTGASADVTNAAEAAWSHLTEDLERAVSAVENPTELLELELQATLSKLVECRLQFAMAAAESDPAAAQDERAAVGQEIGRLARSALLLNQSLSRVQPTAPDAGSPLDQAVLQAAGEIAQIRAIAQQESSTRDHMGDRVTLLADQDITLDNPVFSHQIDSPTTKVFAAEALPQTTDAASIRFMDELSQRVREQQAQVQTLHDAVLPANPRYDLTEFATVFRRWFAFVSPAQEQQQPLYQFAMQLMGAPYRLAGIDTGSPFGGVQSGIGRGLLMDTAATVLTHAMGSGVSTDFSSQLTRSGPRRSSPDVTGQASDPNYDYGELYAARGQSFSADSTGESQSRVAMAQQQQHSSATRFSQVARRPAAEQPAAAVEAGIVPASEPMVPLVGMRNTQAQEGWSYLITVIAPLDPHRSVVAREQKVMPPEVVQYLLARQQQLATLEHSHRPEADGRTLGEGAVEASSATNVAQYMQGEVAPQPDRSAVALQSTLAAARTQAGSDPDHWGPQSGQLVQGVIIELQRYLEQFFVQHQTSEHHLAAVLTIANIEHGVAREIQQLISPESMAQMMQEALRISLSMAALQSLGPLGRLAASGYRAYLNTQGVGEVAAIISVAAFLRNASQAESLSSARAWAVLSRNFVDDLGELFESLVGRPVETAVSHTMDRLTGERPQTPRELADLCRPLMAHAEARQAMLEGVEARLSELETAGAGTAHSDPEYEALVVFRQELQGVSLPQAHPVSPTAGDAPLPGREAETEATRFFGAGRLRTAQQRAALHAALPSDLQGLPIIENPTLTEHTVRVVYRHGDLRMEVGPSAEPSHVRAHAETARHLRRYQGILGTLRRMRDRILSWLRIQPGYGDRGFEARLEVQKLRAIQADLEARQATIEERMAALGMVDGTELVAQADAIAQELASIQEQLEEHAADIDSYTSARGWVAAEARPRLVIARNQIQTPEPPPPQAGASSWDFSLTAEVNGEIVPWGLVSVNLDAHGHPASHPTMLLETRVSVGGQNVILDLPGNLSFTRIALELTNQAYRNTFGRDPERLGGGLADRNLLNFQREFVRIRAANPGWSREQISNAAVKRVSFGIHRASMGYSEIDSTPGPDVEMELVDEAGNSMGRHRVPSSVSVVASRPPDILDQPGRLEREGDAESFQAREYVGDTNQFGSPEARYYANSSLENGIMQMDFVLRRVDLPGEVDAHRSSQLRGRQEFQAALAHFRRIHGPQGVRGVQGVWGGGDNLDRFNAEYRRALREGVDQAAALQRAARVTHTGQWAAAAGFTQATIDEVMMDPASGNCRQVKATFTQ